jgi:hypothetical protein
MEGQDVGKNHIKISAAAANGSQLVLLWKSDIINAMESDEERRIQ